MTTQTENPNIRKGQFLWMNETGRTSYLEALKQKIDRRFYFTDTVIGRIVDDLAPAFQDNLEKN